MPILYSLLRLKIDSVCAVCDLPKRKSESTFFQCFGYSVFLLLFQKEPADMRAPAFSFFSRLPSASALTHWLAQITGAKQTEAV